MGYDKVRYKQGRLQNVIDQPARPQQDEFKL